METLYSVYEEKIIDIKSNKTSFIIMTAYTKIFKRNKKQCLGRFNKELVIRLTRNKKQTTRTVYHLVLTRRRARSGLVMKIRLH